MDFGAAAEGGGNAAGGVADVGFEQVADFRAEGAGAAGEAYCAGEDVVRVAAMDLGDADDGAFGAVEVAADDVL